MRPAIVLAVLSLALAGCFTPDAGEGRGGNVESASHANADSDDAANASAVAGGEVVAAEAPLVTRTVEVVYEGTTGTWMCAPSGAGSCSFLPLPLPSTNENTYFEPDLRGSPVAAEFTLTWEARTPLSKEMILGVFAVRSCGEDCVETNGDMFSERATGASPLTLALPAMSIPPDQWLMIFVGVKEPNPSAGPVLMFYSVDQPFSVDGSIAVLVPAA